MTVRPLVITLLLAAAVGIPALAAEPPPLPGLPPLPQTGERRELPPLPGPPPLPGGKGEGQTPELPPLPSGLEPLGPEADAEPVGFSDWLDGQIERLPIPLHGFWEVRVGPRIVDDPDEPSSFTMGETRLQLETNPYLDDLQFCLRTDFVYDFVVREASAEVREASVIFSPLTFMDVKAGRQILTWGTGDLLFINDLFPKDFVSFLIGRDVEYLKAPSDAVKLSLFSDVTNLDLVYTPQFDPDVFVTGKRLSYYNPVTGQIEGDDVRIRTEDRSSWFTDDEVALRLYRNIGSYETALYGYSGYWKQPLGLNPGSGRFTFPRLAVCGASVRGPVARGIGNVEVGYYDSRDDRSGADSLVPNSQWRAMVGYGQDLPQLAQDFTVEVQYYLAHMDDYGSYERNLPVGMPKADRDRHMMTLRLTKLLMNQDLRLDLFTFWGLTDDEIYLRPYARYAITDRWQIDGGANIFLGDGDHTQFGQLEQNTNVYLGLRYSF